MCYYNITSFLSVLPYLYIYTLHIYINVYIYYTFIHLCILYTTQEKFILSLFISGDVLFLCLFVCLFLRSTLDHAHHLPVSLTKLLKQTPCHKQLALTSNSLVFASKKPQSCFSFQLRIVFWITNTFVSNVNNGKFANCLHYSSTAWLNWALFSRKMDSLPFCHI